MPNVGPLQKRVLNHQARDRKWNRPVRVLIQVLGRRSRRTRQAVHGDPVIREPAALGKEAYVAAGVLPTREHLRQAFVEPQRMDALEPGMDEQVDELVERAIPVYLRSIRVDVIGEARGRGLAIDPASLGCRYSTQIWFDTT